MLNAPEVETLFSHPLASFLSTTFLERAAPRDPYLEAEAYAETAALELHYYTYNDVSWPWPWNSSSTPRGAHVPLPHWSRGRWHQAHLQAYLFEGVQTFSVPGCHIVMALLLVSAFLFVGFVDTLFSVDDGVAHTIFGVIVCFGAISLLSAPTTRTVAATRSSGHSCPRCTSASRVS